MTSNGDLILQHLEAVNAERAARAADGGLALRVTQVKEFQQARFAHTYADLLAHPRYAGASKFFLDDLYGPGDFSQRDAQFARVVPGLVRLFPHEVAETVEALTALHALSEHLDTEMGRHVDAGRVSAATYLAAWRLTGRPQSRQRQIDLMVEVGHALDVYTRRPLLRRSLHLMRAPARVAGLSSLQSFLECGFDTFCAMHGAEEFLAQIAARESALASKLFNAADYVEVQGELPRTG
jgi:hypothetical protein